MFFNSKDQIKYHQSKRISKDVHVYFVPHKGLLCEKYLQDQGVFSLLKIGEYALNFVPREANLYSMELDSSVFKDLFIDGDITCIFNAAQALMGLQEKLGRFGKIIGKGEHSKSLCDLIQRLDSHQDPKFHKESVDLILFDRTVDLISILTTQLTYEVV